MIRKQNIKQVASMSLLAASMAVSLAGNANAQTAEPKHIMIQVGAGTFLDSGSKDFTSSTSFHGGVGYLVPSEGQSTGQSSIDLDYDYSSGHGNKMSIGAITIAQRVPLGQGKGMMGGMHPYYGGGIGFAEIQTHNAAGQVLQSAIGSHTGPSVATTSKSTHFGGKLLAGLDFGGAFAEISYHTNGSVNGVKADTVNLALGMKF